MIDSLRIGPVNYTVNEADDLHYVSDDGQKKMLNGHILHDQATIKVANDLAADNKIVCLWHEALHGILNNAGQDNQPEPLMVAISYGLVQLIRDNPQLIELTVGKQISNSGSFDPRELSKGQNEMLDLEAAYLSGNGNKPDSPG